MSRHACLAFQPIREAVAKRVGVGVVDLPGHFDDARVAFEFATRRGERSLRARGRRVLRDGVDAGDDGAQVVGHEREVDLRDDGPASCAKRLRTWTKRAAGLMTLPGAARGALHSLQRLVGDCVLPVRVDTRPRPWRARRGGRSAREGLASSTLLVHTASAPPMPRTSWNTGGSLVAMKRFVPASTIAPTWRSSVSATRRRGVRVVDGVDAALGAGAHVRAAVVADARARRSGYRRGARAARGDRPCRSAVSVPLPGSGAPPKPGRGAARRRRASAVGELAVLVGDGVRRRPSGRARCLSRRRPRNRRAPLARPGPVIL